MTIQETKERLNEMASQIADIIRRQQGQLVLAKQAVWHVIATVCDDPRKYWLLGEGTESWAKLTAAHAVMSDKPLQTIRDNCKPNQAAYAQYCAEREEEQQLIRHCREHGIKPKE